MKDKLLEIANKQKDFNVDNLYANLFIEADMPKNCSLDEFKEWVKEENPDNEEIVEYFINNGFEEEDEREKFIDWVDKTTDSVIDILNEYEEIDSVAAEKYAFIILEGIDMANMLEVEIWERYEKELSKRYKAKEDPKKVAHWILDMVKEIYDSNK